MKDRSIGIASSIELGLESALTLRLVQGWFDDLGNDAGELAPTTPAEVIVAVATVLDTPRNKLVEEAQRIDKSERTTDLTDLYSSEYKAALLTRDKVGAQRDALRKLAGEMAAKKVAKRLMKKGRENLEIEVQKDNARSAIIALF